MAAASCRSVPGSEAPLPAAAAVAPCAAPGVEHGDSTGAAVPAVQQSAAADWWRCSLSGEVMQDPVLFGSGGHSFEREALEQWLAANPQIQPITKEPLPSGEGSMVPNHALRNTLQQLHSV